jgi:hypothetical protein
MPKAESIREMLAPGGRLDVGRVREVVELVENRSARFDQLVECVWEDDPAVASRAADALERATRDRPARAQRWKAEFLGLMSETTEKKIRWNLALVVPRLKLTVAECRRVSAVLRSYLDDPSSIVKTAALHGITDLSRQDPESLPDVLDLLRVAGRSGTPAMRSRSRILLKAIERAPRKRQIRNSIHMFD